MNSITVGSAAGSYSVLLTTTGTWNVSTNDFFLHISSPLTGAGNALIVFTVDAFTGSGTRNGSLTIAGFLNLAITQVGTNSIAVNPMTTVPSSNSIQPYGIAVNSAGWIFIVNGNDVLVNQGGSFFGHYNLSGLSNPSGLAVQGNEVYVADDGNNRIASFNSVSGDQSSSYISGLQDPRGVAVDSAGNVYIADFGDNVFNDGTAVVQEWSPVTHMLTALPRTNGPPHAVAVDANDNLYIADISGGLYQRLHGTTALTTLATGLSYPWGIAVDGGGNVYVAVIDPPTGKGTIKQWSAATHQLTTVSASPGLYAITGVALDAGGNIYTSVYTSVLKFSPAFETLAASYLQVGSTAGTSSVQLGFLPFNSQAPWTASSANSWLHVTAGSGTGGANIFFTFDPNPGSTYRTGTITLDSGLSLTVEQEGVSFVSSSQVNTVVSSLNGPQATAADQAGNIYIADTLNNQILKWTGVLTTLVPPGAGLNHPQGVALDGSGNLYIADTLNSAIKVWKVKTNSVTNLNLAGLSLPSGVAVDAAGNVYIADTNNNAIKRWNAATQTLTTLIAPTAGLNQPRGIAVDLQGNVYIADSGNSAIKEWNARTGAVTDLANIGGNLGGLSVDPSGNVFFAATGDNVIGVWSPVTGDAHPVSAPGLSGPGGVSVGGGGAHLYVADTNNNAIKAITIPAFSSAAMSKTAGDGQTAIGGQAAGTALQVKLLTTQFGFPIPNATVTFRIISGAGGSSGSFPGTLVGTPTMDVVTLADGTATAPVLTANNVVGTFTVTATAGSVVQTFSVNIISVTLGHLSANFDGTPHPVTVVTNPSGLPVVVTYNGELTPPTASALYNVVVKVAGASVTGTLIIYIGSSGTLAGSSFPSEGGLDSIAVGYLNADSNVDIVVASETGNDVRVYFGNGSGGFTAAPGNPFAVGLSPSSVAVGDVNGDGKPDLVIANRLSNTVTVLKGDGLGGFSPLSGSPFAVGPNPVSVVLGDFNRDGSLDIAVANPPGAAPNNVSILLNTGMGGFAPFVYTDSEMAAQGLAVGDANNDGIPDLFVSSGNQVAVLWGTGNGQFVMAGDPYPVGSGAQYIAVADLLRSGNSDILTANYTDGTVSILLSSGTGNYTAAPGSPFAAGTHPSSIAVTDFNGDGKPDIAVANNGNGSVTVLLGDRLGGFTPASGSPFTAGTSPTAMVAGDFNSDGRADLALASDSGSGVTLLLSSLAATVPVLSTTAPSSVVYGTSVALTLTVAQTSGGFNPVTGTATFLDLNLNVLGTAGQTTPPYTFIASGLAIGTHTLSASYGGDLSNNFSSSNTLTITVTATNQSQTITFSPAVTTYAYSVGSFSVSAAGGGSGNPVTFASSTMGVCTVSGTTVTIVSSGTCTITASQAGSASYAAATPVSVHYTIMAPLNTPPTADSATPASGSGTTQNFTFKYSSVNGFGYLSRVFGQIATSTAGANSCYFEYYLPGSILYLFDNSGSGVAGTLTLGSSSTIGNGQCTLNGTGFTVSGSGNQLTMTVPIAFSAGYAGAKNIYGFSFDNGSMVSGWQTLGSWTTASIVTTPPTADSVAPASGSGTSQNFTFKYSSVNSYGYLSRVFGQIATSTSGANSCYFEYYLPDSILYLFDNSGSGVAGSLALGSSSAISNSQCTITGTGFTVSGTGNQLTMTVPVTFSGSYTGPKNVYGFSFDQGNMVSGWQTLASWTTNTVLNTPPTSDSVTPGSGSGTTQSFTFKYSSVNGYGYLSRVFGQIATSTAGANSCYFEYYLPGNTLYLFDNTGAGVAGSLTLGSSSTIGNSQCTISGTGFTVSGTGNQLTMVVPVTFSGTYAGLKNVYGFSFDQGSMASGWQTLGSWTTNTIVNTPPTADSISPGTGSGAAQTFTFKYSSANGYGYLSRVFGQIATSTTGANSCYFEYYLPGNTLYIFDDTGSGVAGTLTLGSSSSIGNSQCTISGTGFTVSGTGNQLTMVVPVTFSGPYAGLKNVYGFSFDQGSMASGWQLLGAWTTNTIVNTPPTADSVTPASGSGLTQNFTFKYSSVNGFGYLSRVFGQIATNTAGANSCYFEYYLPGNTLYLFDNSGGGVAGTLALGSSSTVSNSQCTINGTGFTVSGTGNLLTMVVPVTFSGSYISLMNTYGFAFDQGSMVSGWQMLGTWTP